MDFELFNYIPWDYFTTIGMHEKAAEVKRLIVEYLQNEKDEQKNDKTTIILW